MVMLQFSRCAWCNDFLNGSDDLTNEAICSTCLEELGTIPNLELANIERNFVDQLPFGNIVLDPTNTIIRYNATESKYTGYDSSLIEGKDFFEEVAPCTRVDTFKGKLDEFRSIGKNNQHLFKFHFNHPKFTSLVSILMTYYENGYVIMSIRKLQ